MGKLVVIEGLDGSGKATQTQLLADALIKRDIPVLHVTFPDYDAPSSALVKMYLNGDFGNAAGDVNAYASSCFYAVDRFASFNMKWKTEYKSGKWIIADRYATSNMIYQLSKLPHNEWEAYINWLEDFEYKKLGLPRPDKVIYLDMPVDVSQELLNKRYFGNNEKKDIHEKNLGFLNICSECAEYSAKMLNWTVIECAANSQPRELEAIHKDIVRAVFENN